MMKINESANFGPYSIEIQEEGHAVIRRSDGEEPNPSFYEMFYLKCLAFGSQSNAIEAYPPAKNFINYENQKHLWCTDYDSVINIHNTKSGGKVKKLLTELSDILGYSIGVTIELLNTLRTMKKKEYPDNKYDNKILVTKGNLKEKKKKIKSVLNELNSLQ